MTDSPPIPEPEDPGRAEMLQVREFILASHDDLVPELVHGETIAELMASVDPARAAFNRIVERTPASSPVTIPAGGNTPVTIDIDTLPTSEKIRRGLAASYRKD